MMRRIGVGLATMLLLTVLAACGGGSQGKLVAGPDGGTAVTTPGDVAGLPGLPGDGAPARVVQGAGPHEYSAADVFDSALAGFTGSELALEHDGLAWAVLGLDGAGLAPAKLDISGSCAGLYIGISDYAAGKWHWLNTTPYFTNDPIEIVLPSGEWSNTAGKFYIALICPDGNQASITASVTLGEAADWNILVWIAGDNNLAEDGANDLNEMESVGSSTNIRVLAGYDIDPAYLPMPVAGTDAVHFIEIVEDHEALSINTTGSPANMSFPRAEYNSADPDNLVAFLDWAATSFPAQHTMLVLWNHGDGWLPGGDGKATSAILSDDTDGPWELTDNTVLATSMAGRHFDILGFDACNMGQLEALYDFHGLADYFIGSQALEPNAGWNYTYMLAEWNSSYPLTLEEIGQKVVTGYNLYYTANTEEATLAAISNEAVEELVAGLGGLAAEVTAKAGTEGELVKQAISAAYEPAESDGCRDLGGFLDAYAGLTSDTSIQVKLQALQATYAAGVTSFTQTLLPDCSGLCLWLPSSTYFTEAYKLDYGTLAFDSTTGWLAMLEACGVPGSGGGGV